MSLRDRATIGVAWSSLHTWGTHALQVGVMLVLARLLEPVDFGLFAMAQVALVFVHAVVDQGIPEALVQANRDDPAFWSTGFIAVAGSATVAALVLFLAAPGVAVLFGTPAVAPVIRWMAPAVALHGIHVVFYARIRANLIFAGHAAAGIAGAAAAFLAGVSAAVAGLGVWALVVSAYAALLVETALLVRAAGWIPLVGFRRTAYVDLLRFGRFIVAGAFTTILNRRSDDYFVGLFLGPEVLGIYAAAYRLLELVTTVFLRSVERVAYPLFARLRESPALVRDALHTSFRFTSMVAFPAFAGLVLVAGDLVVVALGPQWTAAAAPLRILALGGMGLCAINVLPAAIRAAGFPQWSVGISALQGVLLTVSFAVAVRWGLEGVAWAFTGGIYAIAPLFYLAARRLAPLDLRAYLAEGAPAFTASLIMMAGLWIAAPVLRPLDPAIVLALSVLGGAGLYMITMALLAPDHLRELQARLRVLRAARAEERAD